MMNDSEIKNKLNSIKQKLKIDNPGNAGYSDSERFVNAAVLIPFAIQAQELVVLFTHRSNRVNSHRGQVSFPGGFKENSDCDLMDTALRETCEEIGICSSAIDIMGSIAPVKSTDKFLIYPYVGYIRDLNCLHKNDIEVERIFCVPYKWLVKPENLHQEDYLDNKGSTHKVWVFNDFEGEKIWGITAMITKQLIDLLE